MSYTSIIIAALVLNIILLVIFIKMGINIQSIRKNLQNKINPAKIDELILKGRALDYIQKKEDAIEQYLLAKFYFDEYTKGISVSEIAHDEELKRLWNLIKECEKRAKELQGNLK